MTFPYMYTDSTTARVRVLLRLHPPGVVTHPPCAHHVPSPPHVGETQEGRADQNNRGRREGWYVSRCI